MTGTRGAWSAGDADADGELQGLSLSDFRSMNANQRSDSTSTDLTPEQRAREAAPEAVVEAADSMGRSVAMHLVSRYGVLVDDHDSTGGLSREIERVRGERGGRR